ncbi:MAG TPA: Ig-like domain-containing protein [Patescibacteria group bacterium]|nr:MAG: hypothetical protein UR43_C0005G0072 [candidate division TM6 bacterium GW2011_GWF2_33_332]HLD91095.1 Ig-like domain-containing protein [Patescibacteria group bacterium]
MKIDSPKRLNVEDFKDDEKELVEKIGICYNSFAESVYNALNKNLSISENLNQEIKTINNIKVDASGNPVFSISFKHNLALKSTGTQIIRVLGGAITSHPFITYTEENKIIKVSNITGLLANTTYTLTIIIYSN